MRVPATVRIGLLAALLPAGAAAQGDCEIISSGTTTGQNQGTPQEVLSITHPVVHCAGGRRLRADYAVLSQASGQLNLLGNVHFQDSARTLTSTNAQYFSRQRILTASGNAVLVHGATNSVIRGEQVEYHEAGPQRPESLVRAMGGQPRAVLRSETRPDSTTLDAQQIEIFGEQRLRGTGSAVLIRDSLRAVGQVIEYGQDTRELQVTGPRARVEVPRYELYGDSITAHLGEDDQIRDVLTRHTAQLWSADLDLTAPAAKLFFENGGVTRVVAMNWPLLPGAEPAARPHVENEQFRMDADSLDVLAPQQNVTEAVAIGSAYGERLTPDSLKPLLPEAEPEVMKLIANDWMRGDTVRAFFVDNPAAAQDTAAPARLMERLLAIGAPAQSMYRMRDEAAPEAKLSINYLVGTAIEVRFRAGEVAEVISPDAVGVFLEPADAARRARGNRTGGGSGPPGPL
jgi:lipopolysaccharide export system protein LptA